MLGNLHFMEVLNGVPLHVSRNAINPNKVTRCVITVHQNKAVNDHTLESLIFYFLFKRVIRYIHQGAMQ
jgi:hypothetical protein